MFSCEETWNVHLTFGRTKKHVRTFKLKLTDPSQLHQSVGTLWFRLPRGSSAIKYESECIDYSTVRQDGSDRGIDINFQKPEGWVSVSFETHEDTPEGCNLVNFEYTMPRRRPTPSDERNLRVTFHFPMGLPSGWFERLGFLRLLFPKMIRLVTRLPNTLKEFYSPPWGCKIEYAKPTLRGKLQSHSWISRRLVYDEESTEFLKRGQSYLFFTVKPCMEAPIVAIGIGLVAAQFSSVPLWLIILVLILIFPLFTRAGILQFFSLIRGGS